MKQEQHSLALYFQKCIKHNEEISPNIHVNLHSIENIHVIVDNKESFKTFHLLNDLMNTVDIQHWSKFIDENIFNDEELLQKVLYKSLKQRDLRLFKECVYNICKVIFNRTIEDEQNKWQFKNIRSLFSIKIGSLYPTILAVESNNEISQNFLNEFTELKTIIHCLVGTEFDFQFNYAEHPISLQSIIHNKDNWINNFKEQVSIITRKKFNPFSFTDSVFHKSIHPSIDSSYFISRIISQNSTKIHPKKPILISILQHTIDNYDNYANTKPFPNDTFLSIFKNLLKFKNYELINNFAKLKKNTPNNLANIYNESIKGIIDCNLANDQQILFTNQQKSIFKASYEEIKFTLELLFKEKNINSIQLSNPEFLIFNKKFQDRCESSEFLEQYKQNLSKKINTKFSSNLKDTLISILIIQKFKKNKPNFELKLSKNFDNFVQNCCDMTTVGFFSFNQDISKNINSINIQHFINQISSNKIKIEEAEYIMLDITTKKNDIQSRNLKF